MSGARLPGLMAAAAALATAATTADFSQDRLHPAVSPILFHSANNSLLPSASISSSVLSSSSVSYSSSSSCSNFWSPTSLSLAEGAFDIYPAMSSLNSTSRVLTHLTRGAASAASVHGAIYPVKECSRPSYAQLSGPSLLLPSYLCTAFQLPRDELRKQFKIQSSKSIVTSFTFPGLSPIKVPSSPVNSLTIHTFASGMAPFFCSICPQQSYSPVQSKSLHQWHTPTPKLNPDEEGKSVTDEPALTVVLLGWLGSQQKHLKKYAEWYNARGIDAVTFTVPMVDILNFSMGGRAEEHVDQLTEYLSLWLAEESKGNKGLEKHLIFHTFSNTGWLTYGVVLEKLSSAGSEWKDRIKGCVVDSAPTADLDPHVWASGFAAAILKKRTSPASQGVVRDSWIADSSPAVVETSPPHAAESALVVLLEKFFSFFLQIPAISERLSQVVTVLSKQQPRCPQLYIYSTADKIIPSKSVESFMEKQKQEGRVVRACNFQSSQHVEHFRSFPEVYGNQISNFLQECLQNSSTKRN